LPAPSPDRLQLASDNNAFALDMYRRLQGKEGNLFFSPTSLSAGLAMAYSGAGTKTAEEMRRTLRLSLPDERLFEAFAGQIEEANAPRKPFKLSVVNSLWSQHDFPLKPEFLNRLQAAFRARATPVDFQTAPDTVCGDINAWVARETDGRIPKIVDPGMMTAALRLILVNAVYFKGDWALKFKKNATEDQPFYAPKNAIGMVPLMRQVRESPYAEDGPVQVLALPYKGGELSMVVVLPKEKDGLAAVEKTLSKRQLDDWVGLLSPRKVKVELPKFKLEAGYSLGDDLKAMGMPLAFSPLAADFSGMSELKADGLFIGFVLHRAFVEVDEEGTEAAAATALAGQLRMASKPDELPVFRADHPFLFMIRDDRTGAIVFMGRFAKP
ncbi:MAG: serpin family protein, partial [Elusimicrobiota bacterium]